MQKQIKPISLLFLHLFGQQQPPRIQHEVYKQPCTLLNIYSYFGDIVFGKFY